MREMMRHKYEMARYTATPEYRQALQELIKFEIQALIERLADTGEEAVILTASIVDNVSTQFGSSKGEGFLGKQNNLCSKFLSFCCDEATQSSADEMSCEESVVSKSAAPDGDNHRKSNDMPDRTMELSLKVESSNEDADLTNGFGMTTSSVLAGKGKDEKEMENSVVKSSDTKECKAPERPTSASSASNSADLHSDLLFDNDLQCKICNRFFRSMHTLAQHVRFHAVKSYKCSACNKVFSIKASFKQHICSCGHLKSFKCEICDTSFMDQGSWKRHKERHFGIRNHSCDVCGMAFYEKYSLRVHQTSHFYTSLKSDKDVSSGFTCHICQKYFKTKKDMKNHLVAHSTKKYSCEFCNKRFSLKYNYLRHRRIHTGDRPYKCGLCENAFSDSSAWAKHVKMHSVVKGYNCNNCGKAYYDKVSCNNHKKSCKRAKTRAKNRVQSNFGDLGLEISNRPEKKGNKNKDPVNDYEISDSESQIGAEKASFMTENENEHYQRSKITDSGFLEEREQVNVKKKSPSHDPLVTAVVENVKHDIKFQKDFVERHMPDKPFDSENEFLTSNFPEGTEMLDDTFAFTENEVDGNETEDQSDSNDVFPKSGKNQKLLKSHSTPHKRQRRDRRRRHFRLIPESPAKCQRCSKTFKNDNTLKKHQRVHCMLKKLYKCRYCDRQLSSNSALVRHERLHRGERPYECHLCQKCFADKSGCIRHIRVRHHLDNTTKLNIFKPVSDVEIMKPVSDIDIMKPVCKANLGNKFNNLETVNKVDTGRKFTGLKPSSEMDDRNTGTVISSISETIAANVQDLTNFDHNRVQNLVVDDDGNKNSLNDQVKLNYNDESLNKSKVFTEQFEADCSAQNTNTNEQDDDFRVSEPNDVDYIVENSCWPENLEYEPDIPAFEDTTENLTAENIESHGETEKSHLDSRVDFSEAEKSLLNSGGNLYKCGFCGLLFDNEANCSMHISEDCTSYRASLSSVVDNNPTSNTISSDPHVSMTVSSQVATTTEVLSPQFSGSSLLSQTTDLKTYVAGSSGPTTSMMNKISTTRFDVSTLLSQTARLKSSVNKTPSAPHVSLTRVPPSPQFDVSNLLTASLKTTTANTDSTTQQVSMTAVTCSPPRYNVSSLLSQTASLRTSAADTKSAGLEQQALKTDMFELINLQQTSRHMTSNKATTSLLTTQQAQKATQEAQKATQQAQITGQQAQIGTGKPQFVCANIPSQGLKEGDKVRLLLTGQPQKALLASVRLQPSQTMQTNAGLANKLSQSGPSISLLKTNQVLNTSLGQKTFHSVASNQEIQAECSNISNTVLSALPSAKPTMDYKTQPSNSSERITLAVKPVTGGKPSSYSGKPKSFGGKPKSVSNLQNKCLVCSKTFKNKGTLKQHTAIHQDRTFCCQYCVKKFHNKYGLARHLRTHTGEKPYTCVVCSRGFAEKTHLVKHSKQHEPKRN